MCDLEIPQEEASVVLTEEEFASMTTEFQKFVLGRLTECASVFTDELTCAFDEEGQLIIMVGVPRYVEQDGRRRLQ